MTIELSYEWFNNGDDIVPRYSAEEVIRNTGATNTLAGDDRITGVGPGMRSSISDSGIYNSDTIEMGLGNDMITGTYDATEYSFHNANNVFPNNGRSPYRDNRGNFYYYPLEPNGPITLPVNSYGIYNSGTIDTGMGDDTITGSNITGYIRPTNLGFFYGTVTDFVGIDNGGKIDTGRGNDSIISEGKLINGYYGQVLLEDGNDTITTYGVIYNDGEINTGDGNDSIIAYRGFESDLNNSGRVLLGPGEDTLYGFGSGDFDGGNGFDTLALTSGTYNVKRWPDNTGESVVFTKGNSLMITSQFEKLIAGGTTYNFTSLSENQTITVP